MQITVEQIENLAFEIRELLIKHKMWTDVAIYFNGKRLVTFSETEGSGYNDISKVFLEQDVDPRDYIPHTNIEHILSMSFEGDFYQVLNDMRNPEILREFNDLLDQYNLYWEPGNAWNLTCYQKRN